MIPDIKLDLSKFGHDNKDVKPAPEEVDVPKAKKYIEEFGEFSPKRD